MMCTDPSHQAAPLEPERGWGVVAFSTTQVMDISYLLSFYSEGGGGRCRYFQHHKSYGQLLATQFPC